MGRLSSSGATDFNLHRFKMMGVWIYRMSWTVDYYYPSSPLRWPRSFSRDTDEAGARRFCKRHGFDWPWENETVAEASHA